MKDDFASDFEKILKKMSWPSENLNLDEPLERAWQSGVEKLLDLQEPYVKILDSAGHDRKSTKMGKLEIFNVYSSSCFWCRSLAFYLVRSGCDRMFVLLQNI